MDAKYIKNKISYVLENYELSDEARSILVELQEEINDNLNQEERFSVFIKWMSIFKDAANIANIFKEFF